VATLTQHQVDDFSENGFLVLKGVLSREEADGFRQKIIDMIPRDLNIPFPWGSSGGRIKPYHEGYREQETRPGHEDDAIWDTPEFLPLLCHQGVYETAAQLIGRPDLRVQDGSIGITLRNDDTSLKAGGRKEGQVGDPSTAMSQPLHLDPSIPASQDNYTFSPREYQVGAIFYLTDVELHGGGLHVLPGGHRRVQEECAADPKGRHRHNDWLNITGWGDTLEVTGEAGDVIISHYLLPHGASHNRRARTRVAYFTRFSCPDHPFYPPPMPSVNRYNVRQLEAMGKTGRMLLGVDPWNV
jgi:ectoine hydroxylase-related dioxygenase (phytanoyl-CoA dioxygenase family)